MTRFWTGCLCTAAAFAVGGAAVGLLIVETGAYNTAATSPHMPVTVWALHTTMLRSVARQSAGIAPPPITGPQVLAGVRQYEQDCVACHGAPAVDRADWTRGMNPTPPYLLDVTRQMTPAQLYWVIANGAKMTGMPAWGVSRSPQQIWSLVAFLEAQPYLPPRTYLKLRLAVAGKAEPGPGPGVLQDSSRVPASAEGRR
jgi:mono/diheme cytochrome c family protein